VFTQFAISWHNAVADMQQPLPFAAAFELLPLLLFQLRRWLLPSIVLCALALSCDDLLFNLHFRGLNNNGAPIFHALMLSDHVHPLICFCPNPTQATALPLKLGWLAASSAS
jgi:hypothetical protein